MRSDSRLIPLIERSRSSGRSAAPRSYSSAYALTAESGVRSSCEASATKRRSFRSDASCARKDASIRREHDVEREAEAAHLRSLVRVLHPAGEVACRDRGCGAADLLERAQAQPHEPEAERDDRTEHDGGHDELDQEQPVERRTDVRERGGEDEHRTVVLRDRRAHPVLTAALLARDREVADRLAIRGLPRRRRHRVGHRRRRHALAGDRRAGKGGDHRRPVERTHLHERPWRRRPDSAAGAGAAQGMGRLVERAVGAVEQERAQRRVRRDVGDEEPDSRERDDRQQEPRTQRQALAHGYDASSM